MLRAITHLCSSLLLVGTGALAVTASQPAAAVTAASGCVTTDHPLGAAEGYTEFIEGSGSRGSESEGAIAWGGDLAASGMTVGTRLSLGAHEATLVVGGTHGTFNLQKGSAYVTPATGVNFNGGGHYLATNPIDVTAAFADLRTRSAGWATAPATGTAALETVGGQSVLVLSGSDPTLNVFSVTPAQLVSGSGVAYDVPNGAGILVNVSGASVTLQGQMWIKNGGGASQVNDGTMTSRPEVLWNFHQATTVTMSLGSAWGGTILAPYAFLDVRSVGHTIGQMIAKTFRSDFETHQRLYPGSACLPPLPSAEHPSIELDKTASAITDLDGNGPDVGDTVDYAFRVTNTGDVALGSIAVADPMFPGLTCPTGSLAPGGIVSCSSRTHVLDASDVSAGRVDNAAVASGRSPGGSVVDDDDTTSTPVVPRHGPANIRITKQVDDATPAVGQVVTYTITVANTGDSAAEHVLVRDVLPSGVSIVSASAPCTVAGATVTCDLQTVAAGATRVVTVRARVLAPTVAATHQHLVDVQKTEAHVDLEAGQTRTVTVGCAPGYLVTDGSGRIDHLDQGTGTIDEVHVSASHAVGPGTWEVTFVNHATGRAQGKVFAVCAQQRTETVSGHSHELVVGAPVAETRVLGPGRTEVTLSCGPGRTPVTPGYVLDGVAPVVTSYPSGSDDWTFAVEQDEATTGTFSIACLQRTVSDVGGHRHDLRLTTVAESVTVAPGATVEVTLSCGQAGKGIVAGHDVDGALAVLGNDPRPIVRVFRLHNPTTAPLGARLWLLCQGDRTTSESGAEPVVNTATVTTTSVETTDADNASSAQHDVDRDAPAVVLVTPRVVVAGASASADVRCAAGRLACAGSMRLLTATRVVVGGAAYAKGAVLARMSYRVAAGRSATLRLVPTRAGRAVLRSARLSRAVLVVDGLARSVVVRR